MPASVVKAYAGQQLISPHGDEATFALSAPTDAIDEFLSHSWANSGRQKWLSLCLYHNGAAAVCASLVVGALCAVLEANGTLTTLPTSQHRWFDGHMRRVAFGPYAAAYGAFLAVLFFGPSLLPRALSHDPLMFVDKVCIHQTDPRRKQQGIEAINDFIRRSSKMVVCYASGPLGGSYFERLWCKEDARAARARCTS